MLIINKFSITNLHTELEAEPLKISSLLVTGNHEINSPVITWHTLASPSSLLNERCNSSREDSAPRSLGIGPMQRVV